MDSGIRRLLIENERLITFNSSLTHQLQAITDDNVYQSVRQPSFSSVSFQPDTDDSKNFPSDKNFIVFKKQRDLFYEVLNL